MANKTLIMQRRGAPILFVLHLADEDSGTSGAGPALRGVAMATAVAGDISLGPPAICGAGSFQTIQPARPARHCDSRLCGRLYRVQAMDDQGAASLLVPALD